MWLKWRFINNTSFLFPLLSPFLGLPDARRSDVSRSPHIGLDGVLVISIQTATLGKFSHVAGIFVFKAFDDALVFFAQQIDRFARPLDEFRGMVALERLISIIKQTIDAFSATVNGTNKKMSSKRGPLHLRYGINFYNTRETSSEEERVVMSKRRAVTFSVQKEEVTLNSSPAPTPKASPAVTLEDKFEGAMQYVAFQAYYGNDVPITAPSSDDDEALARDKRTLLKAQDLYKAFAAELRSKWTLSALMVLPPDLRDAFKQHADLASVTENDKMTLAKKDIACSHSGAAAAPHIVLHCLDYMKALAYDQMAPQQDSFVQLWSLLNETPNFVIGYKALLNALKAADTMWNK